MNDSPILSAPAPVNRPSMLDVGEAASRVHPTTSRSHRQSPATQKSTLGQTQQDRAPQMTGALSSESIDAAPAPPDISRDPRKSVAEKHGAKHFAKQLFGRTSSSKTKGQTIQQLEIPGSKDSAQYSKQTLASQPPQLPQLPTNGPHDSFDYAATQAMHPRTSQASEPSDIASISETASTSYGIEQPMARSIISDDTGPSSPGSIIPALQMKPATIDDDDLLEPLVDDDPRNFDLVAPHESHTQGYSLEQRTGELLSHEHLKLILEDPTLLQKFTAFMSVSRPKSMPLLVYYLDALKSLRAIKYANAVAEALQPLEGLDFTTHSARPTVNTVLESKAAKAFDTLVQNELPAFVTYTWVHMVSLTIHMRITGTLPPHLRENSEGLAETFCLTDPSRKDNPIIFASEEFHRTTQYGVNYAIGRNCRFLQGPKTSQATIQRLSNCIKEGREISEIVLNYRRDGSTFLNLLVMAPLLDSKGTVRYFIGSQVDVSGLAKDCTDLPALKRLLERQQQGSHQSDDEQKDEFLPLTEMLNQTEVELVRKHGGRMHKNAMDDDDTASTFHQPRLLLKDYSPPLNKESALFGDVKHSGRMPGIYQNYLLVRPYPSLRILFASPSLRIPGMLQSPFMKRIGGSPHVREELERAMAAGRGVTAKVRWISGYSTANDEGRKRWLHCTPLLGQNGSVGVWMVVLVDEQYGAGAAGAAGSRSTRTAPPVNVQGYNGLSKDSAAKMQRVKEYQKGNTPQSPTMDAQRAGYTKSPPPPRRARFDRILSDDEFDREIASAAETIRIANIEPKRNVGEPVSPYMNSGQGSLDSFKI